MDKYQQADHDWRECILRIARRETEEFEAKSVIYSDSLVETNCRRSIMVLVYRYLVTWKMVKPIEELEHDVKVNMWLTIKDICAGRVQDKKKMTDIARVFYVIEYMLTQN